MRTLVLGLSLMFVGCSESRSDAGGGGAGADGGASTTSSGGAGAGGEATSSSGGSSSSAMPKGDVVINEIDANNDWIELVNVGEESFDLSGLLLADSDAGEPKLDTAIEFPEGASLAGGARLFILAKQDNEVEPGVQEPQTVCEPGASPCFYAPFGISDADGDEIFLLDGDRIISSGVYEPAAAADGESWCRLPDGTGDFAVCAPTPSATNAE
jgi:hypothetical protein